MSSSHPQLHFILLLLASCYYYLTHAAANGGKCLPDQARALLQLKRSFFHNPNLSSWQHGTDCCHWEGVGCDRVSGRVVTLDLGGRDLKSTGGLNPALFNLTSLTNLTLAGNDFGMTSLPDYGFERLTELLSLDLHNAGLYGQIPVGIAHLKKLRTLDLSSSGDSLKYFLTNFLYPPEPSFQAFIANLSNLRDLYLDEVEIWDESSAENWSVALANSVPQLQNLGLSACGLAGHIHHSFSQLRFLRTIQLQENGISGNVPGFFAEFSFLTKLFLSDNNFEGQFPTKIFHLENLRYLDVSFNPSLSVQLPHFPPRNNLISLILTETNLSGDIPTFFVHLKTLKSLGLSNIKSLNTTSIASLPSLETLWLSGSETEKPVLSWIGSIKHLRDLKLEGSSFSGAIPRWIRNCTSLTSVQLSGCSLSGVIPPWIGNLTKLSHLDISENSLNGTVPKVLLTLPSLEYLDLSSNELCGPLEDIADPSSSFLSYIDLSGNNLTGHIPKSFFDLTRLEGLLLNSNRLKGAVDLSYVLKIKTLYMLFLSDNMLSVLDVEDGYPFHYVLNIRALGLASCDLQKIPGVLRYANEMSILDLSNNQMRGVIPSWIWVNWKNSLIALNLSNNMLTSLENYPSVIPMHTLRAIDLSSNKLQGNVPILLTSTVRGGYFLDYSDNRFSFIIPDFARYLRNTAYLNLSKNKLSSYIPRSICALSLLKSLDLSYNNFSGIIPSCLVHSGSSLRILRLRDNHFHGMPENIEEGCMLRAIDLNNNIIKGGLARSLSNCRSLEVLDVGNNQILDSFPSWLGKMSNLRVLILRSNLFYGSILGPTESEEINKHFSALQIIDLASNSFYGILNPKWFGKLDAMMANSSCEGKKIFVDNLIKNDNFYEILTFKGSELTFTTILTTFKMIDFSNNAFSGSVPESVGKLIALHGLNMSHNAFTGEIPSKLGDLAQLESLDLSSNKISGTIPQELTVLTYLEVLNLSYNNLSGMIPQGPQLSSFPNSSFEGNAGLCGKPLSKLCNGSGSAIPGSQVSSQDDSVGTILLFVSVGSGFGVGFAVAVVSSVVWQWSFDRFLFRH